MLRLVETATVPYPNFCEFLRERYGRNWVVAHRASRRTEGRTVLTPKRYNQERMVWIADHPAFRLAETLPESEEKTFILECVMQRLN